MSLVTQLSNVITQIGTEFKADRAKMGDLTSLTTSAKTNLVAALNELKASIAGAGAVINDASASTSAVYSSQKTTDLVNAAIAALVNSAPTALDTLKELSDALGGDANFAATITTALGNRLRIDATQTLTSGQKTQGQTNLDVYAKADIGDPTTNFVTVLTAALA